MTSKSCDGYPAQEHLQSCDYRYQASATTKEKEERSVGCDNQSDAVTAGQEQTEEERSVGCDNQSDAVTAGQEQNEEEDKEEAGTGCHNQSDAEGQEQNREDPIDNEYETSVAKEKDEQNSKDQDDEENMASVAKEQDDEENMATVAKEQDLLGEMERDPLSQSRVSVNDTLPRSPETLRLANELVALKAEAQKLANLHRAASEKVAAKLPDLGTLADAQDDVVESLSKLKDISTLVLMDGPAGAGKSTLLNKLLLEDHAEADADEFMGAQSSDPLPIPLSWGGSSVRRLLIVRAGSCRQYFEGRPSLQEFCGQQNGNLRRVPVEEWAMLCSEDGAGSGDPLILEDSHASSFCGGLWVAKTNVESACSVASQWVKSCSDVICVLPYRSDGTLDDGHLERLYSHLKAGRRLLVVCNRHSAQLDAPLCEFAAVLAELESRDVNGDIDSSLLQAVHTVTLTTPAPGTPDQRTEWKQCRDALYHFLSDAEARRSLNAKRCLDRAFATTKRWCRLGTKVVPAILAQMEQDAEDLRKARDLVKDNLDASYLGHVFCSILVGRFDSVCATLAKMQCPDLSGRWGRRATRNVMEDFLQVELRQQLLIAVQESLNEVIEKIEEEERPAFEEINRILRRNTRITWDAEVKTLKVFLQRSELKNFAAHFFGSVSVGVLSGLAATALEALVADLVLGPVGVVAGIATFVAVGVQTADWPTVRASFVKQVKKRHVEVVMHTHTHLDFPGLCERRKCRLLERIDAVLHRILHEVAALTTASNEFADCHMAICSLQDAGGNKTA